MRAKSLNINQAYSMSIVDTAPESAATLYRTSVWISLDDQQLQNPEPFWHLWSSEAEGLFQREDNPRAVELVPKPSLGLLGKEFFDGFSIIWTLETNGCAVCIIAVRFNFLPIDFSHCRRAECVPVRLYAETEVLNTGQNEVNYCKVVLIQVDGADRKMSTEVQSVMNTSYKLNQEITQLEGGIKVRERKRTGLLSGDSCMPARRKIIERKQTSPASSRCGARVPIQQQQLLGLDYFFQEFHDLVLHHLNGS